MWGAQAGWWCGALAAAALLLLLLAARCRRNTCKRVSSTHHVSTIDRCERDPVVWGGTGVRFGERNGH